MHAVYTPDNGPGLAQIPEGVGGVGHDGDGRLATAAAGFGRAVGRAGLGAAGGDQRRRGQG